MQITKAITAAITLWVAPSSSVIAEEGRFQAVAQAGGPGVYVLDTETGEVKYCHPRRDQEAGSLFMSCTSGEAMQYYNEFD